MLENWLRQIETAQPAETRPLVTLSYAQSLDGSLAYPDGRPAALSGAGSTILTHRLRAMHDAILVGIGTVLTDNPRLTVRLAELEPARSDRVRHPQPVILDDQLRMPLDSHLMTDGPLRPWIASLQDAGHPRAVHLATQGARLITFKPDQSGHIPWPDLLGILRQMGIRRLMVEGGRRVISTLLAGRFFDFLVVTIAPRFLGGVPILDPELILGNNLEQLEFAEVDAQCLGEDLIWWARCRQPEA